jgi:hypothetical protein
MTKKKFCPTKFQNKIKNSIKNFLNIFFFSKHKDEVIFCFKPNLDRKSTGVYATHFLCIKSSLVNTFFSVSWFSSFPYYIFMLPFIFIDCHAAQNTFEVLF